MWSRERLGVVCGEEGRHGLSTWGRLGGEKLDLARHEPATFHHLPPTNTRWTQRIVASCQYRALPTKRQGSRCSARARIASFPPLRPPPPSLARPPPLPPAQSRRGRFSPRQPGDGGGATSWASRRQSARRTHSPIRQTTNRIRKDNARALFFFRSLLF